MDFTVFEVRSTHTVKDKTKSLFFRESISKYSRISDVFQGLYLKIIEARNTHTDAQLKYFWALNSGMGAQGEQTLRTGVNISPQYENHSPRYSRF